MLDQIYGRPSSSWKRTQVFVMLYLFYKASTMAQPPPVRSWRRLNAALARKFTPWQVFLGTLTMLYAVKHTDALLGLQAPEPLSRLYSRNYYRATWIVTALDAGFATAMEIKPKWLRDVASMAFSVYYLFFANEADEKLRKYRSVATVEMLRVTWEKTTNPIIRFVTMFDRPRIGFKRKVLLPRPKGSKYSKPISATVLFYGTEAELAQTTELIFDVPGGGFICMNPAHHEERTIRWTQRTRRPVICFDYGKAPEYPYPYAMDEMYDAYRLLVESRGTCIGMKGSRLDVVLTGDSAGANIGIASLIRVIEERLRAGVGAGVTKPKPSGGSSGSGGTSSSSSSSYSSPLPLPVALVQAYVALDFNFTSWMSNENLAVLRQEVFSAEKRRSSSVASVKSLGGPGATSTFSNVFTPGEASHPSYPWGDGGDDDDESKRAVRKMLASKDHWEHKSPLSVVEDLPSAGRVHSPRFYTPLQMQGQVGSPRPPGQGGDVMSPRVQQGEQEVKRRKSWGKSILDLVSYSNRDEDDGDDEATPPMGSSSWWSPRAAGHDKSLSERVVYWSDEVQQEELRKKAEQIGEVAARQAFGGPMETRLTMTSRTAFFNDRIISPAMCRAMAILYVGPRNAPDLHTDYHISPIFTPSNILSQMPPVYLSCGERDPFVDDTVIFAGKIREAKESLKHQLRTKAAAPGESLRMSQSPKVSDPILEEDEDDWMHVKIIEGWSHGYLQMMNLLPEAWGAVDMTADWISEAFDKAAEKRRATAPQKPALVEARASKKAEKKQAAGEADDSSDEEDRNDVLSFTPKRRVGSFSSSASSRSNSPFPPPNATAAAPSSDSLAAAGSTSPTLLPSKASPLSTFSTSSHENLSIHNALPLTATATSSDDSGALSQHGNSPPSSKTSVSGDSLSTTQPIAMPKPASANGLAVSVGSPPGGVPTLVATPPPFSPSASKPLFVSLDARDMLRRRREDAVFGISSNTPSNAPSDEDEELLKKPDSGATSKVRNNGSRDRGAPPASANETRPRRGSRG